MFTYFGQCDRLRKQGAEHLWQRMIQLSVPITITITEFEQACDPSGLLDENETLDDYIRGSDAEFFASYWGDQPCMFIDISGFEFIFK